MSVKGLSLERVLSTEGIDPLDEINWVKRDCVISENDGTIVYEAKDIEAPEDWSQLSVDIVASKYLKRGGVPKIKKETSIRQLVDRVVTGIVQAGIKQGDYFARSIDRKIFEDELKYIFINQYASTNSPVWFNCGLYHKYGMEGNAEGYYYDFEDCKPRKSDNCYKYPQNSACFIQSVDDSIDSMIELQKSEIKLFKQGSGTGTNFSNIRAKGEPLSGGGEGSGVLSFLEGYDAWAGSIKSGGTTRRSAKMVLLDADHPEIFDFINWKVREEKKAKALIDAGYEANFNGEAYRTVSGQNSNNSVRLTDQFMEAYENGHKWQTRYRTNKGTAKVYEAEEVMSAIAEAAWECADPGVQFDTTINKWHTCTGTDRINASNPCSEFLFLDNTACNLASINLVKFLDDEGKFDVDKYVQTIKVLIIAMDIIVDMSSYPTEKIALNSHDFRPLGLGYANLGSLLMRLGHAYDSEHGRWIAAYLASLLSGYGYWVSARLARAKGCFAGYHANNRFSMKKVMNQHHDAAIDLGSPEGNVLHIRSEYKGNVKNWDHIEIWKAAMDLASTVGYRNSQISVIAPTGTIAFMMDCDTTGIEPDFSLVKYKTLAGGGILKINNVAVKPALLKLGYTEDQIKEILPFVLEKGTIENAPHVRTAHYDIFDCAVGPAGSKQVIHYMAHVEMLAAVQPFISGGISKTVNLPSNVKVEDIKDLYVAAWDMGVKCLAVYRDGCKDSQPLNTSEEKKEEVPQNGQVIPQREKLPTTRKAIAHRFSVDGHKGYLHVGLYEDGKPGEIFMRMNREGSTLSGLMDTIGVLCSVSLQYGVPLQSLVDKFKDTNFEPSGFTENPDIPTVTSITDYVFRYLEKEFLDEQSSN